MKNLLHTILACIAVCVVINVPGCNPGVYHKELSGHCAYDDASLGGITIFCDSFEESIYPNVVAYDYDNDFIIVCQRPDVKGYRTAIGFDLRNDQKKYPENSDDDRIKTEAIADSMIKHDPFYQKVFSRPVNYWIIVNASKKCYGPFSKEEFLGKRRELNVPDDLNLKE